MHLRLATAGRLQDGIKGEGRRLAGGRLAGGAYGERTWREQGWEGSKMFRRKEDGRKGV